MSWKTEHGAGYEVPAEFLNANFTDMSWKNDDAPRFAAKWNPRICIWVEHPAPEQRQNETKRFAVTLYKDDELIEWKENVFETDDLKVVVAWLKNDRNHHIQTLQLKAQLNVPETGVMADLQEEIAATRAAYQQEKRNYRKLLEIHKQAVELLRECHQHSTDGDPDRMLDAKIMHFLEQYAGGVK